MASVAVRRVVVAMTGFFVADDLSGALDAAGAFHRAGFRVRIVLDAETWVREPDDEVVAVTTETRNLSSAAAEAAVRRALEHAATQGARLLYKKIDSTLRGSVAAELRAVLAAEPGVHLLFCPANPAVGRTVTRGILHVHGVPVSETEFARDPLSPVRESEIRRVLDKAFEEHVTFADAQVEGDLAAAVAGMVTNRPRWLAVGSGALARPVAAWLAASRPHRPVAHAVQRPSSAPPRRMLFVSGSAHPLNWEQAQRLTAVYGVPCHEVQVGRPETAAAAAMASLDRGEAAALLLEAARQESQAALRTIAAAAAQACRGGKVQAVFVTGGETAFALCDALGTCSLHFNAEIEPGLGVSRASIENAELVLAIKPGGFGDANTWVRAWEQLKRFGLEG